MANWTLFSCCMLFSRCSILRLVRRTKVLRETRSLTNKDDIPLSLFRKRGARRQRMYDIWNLIIVPSWRNFPFSANKWEKHPTITQWQMAVTQVFTSPGMIANRKSQAFPMPNTKFSQCRGRLWGLCWAEAPKSSSLSYQSHSSGLLGRVSKPEPSNYSRSTNYGSKPRYQSARNSQGSTGGYQHQIWQDRELSRSSDFKRISVWGPCPILCRKDAKEFTWTVLLEAMEKLGFPMQVTVSTLGQMTKETSHKGVTWSWWCWQNKAY